MMSIDLSGVLTTIAPSVASQKPAIPASTASRSTVRYSLIVARASSRVVASPRKKTISGRAARRYLQLRAHRGARVQPGADLIGKRRRAGQGRRARQCAIAADELAAIARQLRLCAAHVGEGDTRAERRIPGIARKDRACFGILLGFNERERSGSRCTERPLDESRDAEAVAGGPNYWSVEVAIS